MAPNANSMSWAEISKVRVSIKGQGFRVKE